MLIQTFNIISLYLFMSLFMHEKLNKKTSFLLLYLT